MELTIHEGALVFLDTQVYDAEAFNMESRYVAMLATHLEFGRLVLVTTDITKAEIRRRIDVTLAEEVSKLATLASGSRVLRSAHMIRPVALFEEVDRDEAQKNLQSSVENYLRIHRAVVVEAMAQDARRVFDRYFAIAPPFGPKSKRKEFPDAFVVEALIEWFGNQQGQLCVVSGDTRFRDAFVGSDRIQTFSSLSCLLERVASEDAAAEDLKEQILGYEAEIQDATREKFEGLSFYLECEWGDVEVRVTAMEVWEDPRLIYVGEPKVIAELRFKTEYTAHLSYDDSSTGTYDREEGQRVFMEHVTEDVSKSIELVATVTATFRSTDEDAFKILSVDLVEPAEGFGISPPIFEDEWGH